MFNITIIGAGHGGVALAAHFAANRCNVILCADPDHPGFANDIINNGNYIVSNNHCNKQFNAKVKINQVTFSYKTALERSEIIFIVTPAFAHEGIFKKLLPYIEKNKHNIITVAGNFSTIIFNNLLQESNIHKKCTLVDISSLPYACRVNHSGYTVDIFGIKNKMGIAGIPATATNKIIDLLQHIFPTKLIAYRNSIEVGLNITSGISHPVSALFNAGRIGADKELFYFYKDGISEHTSVILEQLDYDRRYIGSLYGLTLPKYVNLMAEFYGDKYNTIHEFFTNSIVHNTQKLCPRSLSERYISQDIPYVIVPWYTLGLMQGFDSKVMRSIIDMSSIINQTNYLKSGINQKKLMSFYSSINNFINSVELGCLRCFPIVA